MGLFGCVLATLILKMKVIFKDKGRIDQLIEIAMFTCYENLIECHEKYKLCLDNRVVKPTAFDDRDWFVIKTSYSI